jgi:hypothetical protein
MEETSLDKVIVHHKKRLRHLEESRCRDWLNQECRCATGVIEILEHPEPLDLTHLDGEFVLHAVQAK